MRERILARMARADGPVSGDVLASELRITRAAVWKHVRTLRQQGIRIESRLGRGYLLESDVLSAQAIGAELNTRIVGRPCMVLDEVDSTNSEAMRLAHDGAAEGLVVLAERQGHGRGRLQRLWHTLGEDSLAMSVLLRPPITPERAPQLSLLAGIALQEALSAFAPELRIKWPNDILDGALKVAGILTEVRSEPGLVQAVVIGIGVNVRAPGRGWPKDIRNIATDLSTSAGIPLSRIAVAVRIMESLERNYLQYLDQGLAEIRRRWWRAHAASGERVRVHDGAGYVKGVAEGIDEDGALLLRCEGDLRRIIAGDLEMAPDGKGEARR